MDIDMELICPVCGRALCLFGNSFYCENKHCFDRAKSGYVNLLLANAKHSKIPGDNKLMVNARTSFLDQGYYTPLADALCSEIKYIVQKNQWKNCDLLDAGCGEGYYTNQLYQRIVDSGISLNCIGIDISKFALDRASKRNRQILYSAASIFHLPIGTEQCDIVTNLFAPFCREEFLRVLRPNGYLVMVIPGEYHLWELKQSIYKTPYPNEVKGYEIPGFNMCKAKNIDTEIELKTPQDIQNLFMMTPYFYNTSKDESDKIKYFTSMETRISFEILIYQKENGHD